ALAPYRPGEADSELWCHCRLRRWPFLRPHPMRSATALPAARPCKAFPAARKHAPCNPDWSVDLDYESRQRAQPATSAEVYEASREDPTFVAERGIRPIAPAFGQTYSAKTGWFQIAAFRHARHVNR